MKTAVVTGAAGGIGRALCAAFTKVGYRVIGVDRVPAADSTSGIHLCHDILDVCRDGAERTTFVRDLREAVGDELAVLINNAAIQIVKPIADLTAADWTLTMQTNVHAPFALTQLFTAELVRARGSVINLASIHATLTKPGFVAYATSKAALVGMTRAMAVDLSGSVRVNAILPAAIDTLMLREGFKDRAADWSALERMHPSGRLGSPDEVARVAVFLASDGSGFANGAIWNMDGGIGSRLHDPV